MIILECIKDKNKLRIRFNSFIDSEGKVFTNVYNNMYNVNYFYTNCGLSILSFILYILSFNKAINLLVLLR